eukprot:1140511-Pelagomonas_calceolata.AAC.6
MHMHKNYTLASASLAPPVNALAHNPFSILVSSTTRHLHAHHCIPGSISADVALASGSHYPCTPEHLPALAPSSLSKWLTNCHALNSATRAHARTHKCEHLCAPGTISAISASANDHGLHYSFTPEHAALAASGALTYANLAELPPKHTD